MHIYIYQGAVADIAFVEMPARRVVMLSAENLSTLHAHASVHTSARLHLAVLVLLEGQVLSLLTLLVRKYKY